MADQGRWFKVWTSIVDDDDFEEMSLQDIGRWVLLGAHLKLRGQQGRILIPYPATHLQKLFRVPSYSELITILHKMHGVNVHENVNGTNIVNIFIEMPNWSKYQHDSTVAERVKRHRVKRSQKRRESEENQKRNKEVSSFSSYEEKDSSLNGEARVSPQELAESWNDICTPHGLRAVTLPLKGSRLEKAKVRLIEHPTVSFWEDVLNKIPTSKFLLGRSGNGTWKATFDWLIQNDKNCLKVMEGQYG